MDDFELFVQEYEKRCKLRFEKAKTNMITAKEYVKKHNHINYCEVIIARDGLIAEAHPSHVEFLRMYAGLTNEDVLNLDKDMLYTPIDVLLKYTGCVAVWYGNYHYIGDMTVEQISALETLIEHKVVCFTRVDSIYNK